MEGVDCQALENKLVRVKMASVAVSTAAASQVKVEGNFMSMLYLSVFGELGLQRQMSVEETRCTSRTL